MSGFYKLYVDERIEFLRKFVNLTDEILKEVKNKKS